MKLPLDQRRDGEATFATVIDITGTARSTPAAAGWRKVIRRVGAWLRLVVDGGPEIVDIPDRLRKDAGLPPADPPRGNDPFDRPPQW